MRIAALILAFSLASSCLAAAERDSLADLPAGDRVEALLARVQEHQAELHALSADFVQRRHSPLLLEPEEARGVFSYQEPDRVRWEYASPDPITMVIRGEKMTTWYPDLDRADLVQIGAYSEKILEYLGASGSVETLFRYFSVTARFPKDETEPYRLDLEPRTGRVAKRIAGMTLWVDRQLYLPTGILYQEPDGAETEYRFENLRINEEMPADLFELELPEGTQVREIDLARGGT